MTDTSELEKLHNKHIIGLKLNILHKVGLPNGQKKSGKLFFVDCSYLLGKDVLIKKNL